LLRRGAIRLSSERGSRRVRGVGRHRRALMVMRPWRTPRHCDGCRDGSIGKIWQTPPLPGRRFSTFSYAVFPLEGYRTARDAATTLRGHGGREHPVCPGSRAGGRARTSHDDRVGGGLFQRRSRRRLPLTTTARDSRRPPARRGRDHPRPAFPPRTLPHLPRRRCEQPARIVKIAAAGWRSTPACRCSRCSSFRRF
jgi:hypothetical protein